ncbi:hypothetical protein G3N56_00305 [Desulfovibrio sulfodismutans]|uniref:Uncharacterized protein n=1 Tax=Desulfolutivibrio sulfodismutans TaxID=63561 RepID=A0A7K3NGI2_9BACT|nr:hypothetical protein [Desulfolutivibrio sulfodismutans]NDY55187.1 hypothetical protein [Desulfolutivibrio sulfodismutans]QLA12153.1 hypothetical protein GD606_07640 [Desulfolutivibrio sulfodismutans DSM 3696]
MSLRFFVFLLAIALQAWFALAWAFGSWRMAWVDGDNNRPRTSPRRLARVTGVLGVGSGLAYAAMAGDPVFFVGQAIVLALAGRVMATPPGQAEVRRNPDGDRTGRNPG